MRLPWLKAGGADSRKTLRRELIAALAIKLLVLAGLWAVFFSRPAFDGMTEGMAPGRVAAAIVSAPAPTPPPRDSQR